MSDWSVSEVIARIEELEDPKVQKVNEKQGDDHGVKLADVRALAKEIKSNHDLAERLWETGNTAAQLVAVLISEPTMFTNADMDRWLREARTPKVRTWVVNYIVKKGHHSDGLRQIWFNDPTPEVAAAGWDLTTAMIEHRSNELDMIRLLEIIEKQMKDAPEPLQWAMNNCLANIGIHHAYLRERAIGIGEKLEVLKDYPTPLNCTSPYAPTWINEVVSKNENK